MNKTLRKAIANRSRLENRYYHNKTDESKRAYKKQKNYCSRLYKKERKRYYMNLDTKYVTDNKMFWKTMKPFFSDKGLGKSNIILIKDEKIISDDLDVANTLNTYFDKAVASLNTNIPKECTTDTTNITDTIQSIIVKYSNHPSILNIGKISNDLNFPSLKLELRI